MNGRSILVIECIAFYELHNASHLVVVIYVSFPYEQGKMHMETVAVAHNYANMWTNLPIYST